MQFCINTVTHLVCKNAHMLRQFTFSSWVHWLQSCAMAPNIFFIRPTEINPMIWNNWYRILSAFFLIYNSSCYTFVFPAKKISAEVDSSWYQQKDRRYKKFLLKKICTICCYPTNQPRDVCTSGAGLPYYCEPILCGPDVIGGLAVWRHTKPKTKNTSPPKNNSTPWLRSNFLCANLGFAAIDPKKQWRKQVLRIFCPKLTRINEWIKIAASAASFENLTLVGESISGGFWRYFGCTTPSKRGILVHKNSLTSCQQYCHNVESHAMTCPFKQSDLSAWSPLSWQPTHTYLWGRLCFIHSDCSPLSLSRRVTQIMSTEALLLNASFKSFSTSINWYTQQETSNQMHPRIIYKVFY